MEQRHIKSLRKKFVTKQPLFEAKQKLGFSKVREYINQSTTLLNSASSPKSQYYSMGTTTIQSPKPVQNQKQQPPSSAKSISKFFNKPTTIENIYNKRYITEEKQRKKHHNQSLSNLRLQQIQGRTEINSNSCNVTPVNYYESNQEIRSVKEFMFYYDSLKQKNTERIQQDRLKLKQKLTKIKELELMQHRVRSSNRQNKNNQNMNSSQMELDELQDKFFQEELENELKQQQENLSEMVSQLDVDIKDKNLQQIQSKNNNKSKKKPQSAANKRVQSGTEIFHSKNYQIKNSINKRPQSAHLQKNQEFGHNRLQEKAQNLEKENNNSNSNNINSIVGQNGEKSKKHDSLPLPESTLISAYNTSQNNQEKQSKTTSKSIGQYQDMLKGLNNNSQKQQNLGVSKQSIHNMSRSHSNLDRGKEKDRDWRKIQTTLTNQYISKTESTGRDHYNNNEKEENSKKKAIKQLILKKNASHQFMTQKEADKLLIELLEGRLSKKHQEEKRKKLQQQSSSSTSTIKTNNINNLLDSKFSRLLRKQKKIKEQNTQQQQSQQQQDQKEEGQDMSLLQNAYIKKNSMISFITPPFDGGQIKNRNASNSMCQLSSKSQLDIADGYGSKKGSEKFINYSKKSSVKPGVSELCSPLIRIHHTEESEDQPVQIESNQNIKEISMEKSLDLQIAKHSLKPYYGSEIQIQEDPDLEQSASVHPDLPKKETFISFKQDFKNKHYINKNQSKDKTLNEDPSVEQTQSFLDIKYNKNKKNNNNVNNINISIDSEQYQHQKRKKSADSIMQNSKKMGNSAYINKQRTLSSMALSNSNYEEAINNYHNSVRLRKSLTCLNQEEKKKQQNMVKNINKNIQKIEKGLTVGQNDMKRENKGNKPYQCKWKKMRSKVDQDHQISQHFLLHRNLNLKMKQAQKKRRQSQLFQDQKYIQYYL